MEYGIEDGEIVADESEHQEQLSEQEGEDVEYDPLMAGNLEVFSTLIIITCSQGRIIHCAGCTMGGGPRRQGAPADQLPNFYHSVLTFERSVYV